MKLGLVSMTAIFFFRATFPAGDSRFGVNYTLLASAGG